MINFVIETEWWNYLKYKKEVRRQPLKREKNKTVCHKQGSKHYELNANIEMMKGQPLVKN